MVEYIIVALIAIICFCLGYILGRLAAKHKIFGRLVINQTDPKKDILRFELTSSIGDILSRRIVSFNVVHEDSQ